MQSPAPLNHIHDLNRLANIYSTLKAMRLDRHEMVRACVDRVWELRKDWLVTAFVPEQGDAERSAWIYSMCGEEEDAGSGNEVGAWGKA